MITASLAVTCHHTCYHRIIDGSLFCPSRPCDFYLPLDVCTVIPFAYCTPLPLPSGRRQNVPLCLGVPSVLFARSVCSVDPYGSDVQWCLSFPVWRTSLIMTSRSLCTGQGGAPGQPLARWQHPEVVGGPVSPKKEGSSPAAPWA